MRLKVKMHNPLWEVRDRYSKSVFITEFNYYIGEVAHNFHGISKDQFALTTGDSDAPFRILEKDSVVCAWRLSDDTVDNAPRMVSIPGKYGKSYTVTLDDSGLRFSCNCTGFYYRRTCSHVEEVMAA